MKQNSEKQEKKALGKSRASKRKKKQQNETPEDLLHGCLCFLSWIHKILHFKSFIITVLFLTSSFKEGLTYSNLNPLLHPPVKVVHNSCENLTNQRILTKNKLFVVNISSPGGEGEGG